MLFHDMVYTSPSSCSSSGAAASREMSCAVVQGHTLPLNPRRVTRCCGAQMASALASLHGQGMVHMDVKPANIMVGDDGAYKLGDFGLAARLDGDGGSIMEGDSRCGAGLAADPGRMQATAANQTSAPCEPRVEQHQVMHLCA